MRRNSSCNQRRGLYNSNTNPVKINSCDFIKKDVLAGAQTGTGKTAGFTLPLLQRLKTSYSKDKKSHVRALILTPTRELAAQVAQSVETYGKYLPFKSAVIFGGVGINPQISLLKKVLI